MPDVKEIAAHLLSEPRERDKISAVLSRPEVKKAVSAPRAINREYDVPYLAGSSKDGGTTYIDRRIPEVCKIGDAECDPGRYLNVHEQTEHALMTTGAMAYEDAHSIATEKERAAVEGDGHSWKDYEKTMDGYLDETEHEKPKNPPPDLYLKPYPHDKEEILRRAAEKEKRETSGKIASELVGRGQ